MAKVTAFHCDSCGRNLAHKSNFTTGYGYNSDKLKHCFHCCGESDRDDMAEAKPGDKVILYLTYEDNVKSCNCNGWLGVGVVTNWPGTLRFKTGYVKRGGHNIARVRYDVWFKDHTGAMWHGTQYGDNTQICHCRKLKPEA